MAERSGTAAESEVASEPGAALVPMGQFLGRPDLPLSRAVTTIGARETCRLQLDSRSISRVHALIVSTRQGSYVADLCSRTGVLVNGRSIRDTDLATGDRIQLGRFTFRFRGSDAPAETAAPDNAARPTMPAAAALAIDDGQSLTPIPGRAFLIGRRDNADLPLTQDGEVSTVHAVLFQMNGHWYVRDLASRTGTRVNGTPIETQQRVGIGDTVEIGSAVLTLAPAPPRAEPAETEEHALPLEADLPPVADFEPLDFSAIDSIEAGGTADDAVAALTDEPVETSLPLADEGGASDDDSGAAQAAPTEPFDEAIEPALEVPETVPAAVEPVVEAEAVEPLVEASNPVAEVPESPVEVDEATEDPAAAVPQAKPRRKPADRKPAGGKRGRARRKPPEPVVDEAQGVSAVDAAPADAVEAEAFSAAVGEVRDVTEPTPESALELESALDSEPEIPEVADTTAELAPPEAVDPLSDTGLLLAVEAFAEPSTGPLVTGPLGMGPLGVETESRSPAESPAEVGRPLELAELAEGEEFVAVPEPEETLTEAAAETPPETPPSPLTVEPAAVEAAIPAESEEGSTELELAADDELPPELPLTAEPIEAAEPTSEPVSEAGEVNVPAVALSTEEATDADEWLIDEAPPELPLTVENTEPAAPASAASAAAELSATLPEGDLLLGEAAATTASAAGPGVFGFSFEGGSFLGGMALPAEKEPAAPESAPPEPVESEPLETEAASAATPATPVPPVVTEPPQEVAEVVVEPSPSPALPGVDAPRPAAPVASAPAAPPAPAAPTPIPTLSDEITVPPLATPARTPPRQRRPLSTAFDGLSNGAKITGFVGGISVNGRGPASRGGPSVDVFSQQAPAIAADALLGEAFPPSATGTSSSRRTSPMGIPPGAPPTARDVPPPPAPAQEPAPAARSAGVAVEAPRTRVEPLESSTLPPEPTPPASRGRRRWLVWGLLGLMFVSLGAVWAAVYALVPQACRVTGTLRFTNLSQQSESAQRAFEADQIARLHSNEVRTMARSILLAGGAPTGFTEDMMSLGRALDRDGTATFSGDTLTVNVRASDPIEGRSQLDALLSALAKRDMDLGDTQTRAAQDLADANAAVATMRDRVDALKAELLTARARGEDRPDPEEIAALQAASNRAERLVLLARGTRLNAEAELELLRQPLPKPAPAGEAGAAAGAGAEGADSPRDAQLTRLRWELQDLARQVNDVKSTRPDANAAPAAPPALAAAPGPSDASAGPADAANESLLAYLDAQVQALSTALSDQATGIPGPAGEAVRLRQMEALSVRTHDLQQAEKTAQDNAQRAVDQLRGAQGRLDSARQATVEIDQLIADIRSAETTLREKSDAAAAAQQQASFAVSVAGEASESVQPLSDQRPVYAGVLSGLVLCVFSGLTINAMRSGPDAMMVDAISGDEIEPGPTGTFPAGVEPIEEPADLEHADSV